MALRDSVDDGDTDWIKSQTWEYHWFSEEEDAEGFIAQFGTDIAESLVERSIRAAAWVPPGLLKGLQKLV